MNKLHDVIMKAILIAHAVDLDDVGMVKPRRQAGLTLETRQVTTLQKCLARQNLQRHPPTQRFLLCLEDDPHPTATDLA